MKALIGYKIPFSGLKKGIHHFDFNINKAFFQHFENSLIENSDLNIHLAFDKQSRMFVLDFDFEGTIQTICDRCADNFDLPIKGNQQFIIKMREEPGEDEDIIYIHETAVDYNVASLIYELLHLNLPIKKACALTETEEPICGFDFSQFNSGDEVEDDDNQDDIWSALKNLKI
ncbi:MAG: DUF177 domain-containing protein [Saprospiraceae bacterium]